MKSKRFNTEAQKRVGKMSESLNEALVVMDLDTGDWVLPDGRRIKAPDTEMPFSRILVFNKLVQKKVSAALTLGVGQGFEQVFGEPIDKSNPDFKPKPAA
jgi:hypothetical protein